MQKYRILLMCCLLLFTVSVAVCYIPERNRQKRMEFIGELQEESVRDAHVFAVCEAVKNMDFTIREPRLELTEEEDRLYKEAYLKVLKNEMPILEWPQEYYKDLEKAGIALYTGGLT